MITGSGPRQGTYPRCAGCGFTHDKCLAQEDAERLLHALAAALQEDSSFAREQALKDYEAWL